MARRWVAVLIVLLTFSFQVEALVSMGAYVPFGSSTQKDSTGGRNTFSFDPAFALNTVLPIEAIKHLFLPELGFVLHGTDDYEDYSKTTMYILLDLAYPLTDQFALRYGLGTFLTKIKGQGGTVQRLNGSTPTNFDRPAKESTSYNTTLDLGIENKFGPNWSARLETFWFSLLNSEARDVSYMLNATYYL